MTETSDHLPFFRSRNSVAFEMLLRILKSAIVPFDILRTVSLLAFAQLYTILADSSSFACCCPLISKRFRMTFYNFTQSI